MCVELSFNDRIQVDKRRYLDCRNDLLIGLGSRHILSNQRCDLQHTIFPGNVFETYFY